MIQLSQEITEATELHPVTACEQGEWNLEAPCRTTRLRGSLPIRRLQIGLGLLYRTLKHTNKPKVRTPVRCESRYVVDLAR